MSKKIDRLTAEDFGKSFDAGLFSEWKTSVEAHEKVAIATMLLYFIGLAGMIVLGGLVGVGLFFILAFVGLGISLPKQSKVKGLQRKLGITGSDIRAAVAKSNKRQS